MSDALKAAVERRERQTRGEPEPKKPKAPKVEEPKVEEEPPSGESEGES